MLDILILKVIAYESSTIPFSNKISLAKRANGKHQGIPNFNPVYEPFHVDYHKIKLIANLFSPNPCNPLTRLGPLSLLFPIMKLIYL